MLSGENVIIFSSDDWSSGLKTSKYHLAKQLARQNRVLFVNSIGLRSPGANARDLGRIFSKLASFFKGARRVPEGLWVYTPIAIPFKRNHPVIRAANAFLLRMTTRWLQWRLRLKKPVVFTFIPTFNDVIGRLNEKTVVYYCIDDLRGYAGVDAKWFDAQEDWLLAHADCVISSARELHEAFQQKNACQAFYIPHGVDWTLFRTAVTNDLPEPLDLAAIPPPRLGFYGFLSDEWVDYPLLKRMAQEHPGWHIVLIGRPKGGMDMAALLPEPNIHYLGLKPFTELPSYTRHFDVGLIPFCINPLTHHSNPLKLLEYLSGGLPVVSTQIPEVRQYDGMVRIAGGVEDFIKQCENALAESESDLRDARSLKAEAHSWERRMEQISGIVTDCLRKGTDKK